MEREYLTSEEFCQLRNLLEKSATRTLVCFCIDVSDSMRMILQGQDYKIDERRSGQMHETREGRARDVYALPGYTLENRVSKLNSIFTKMLTKMKANERLRDSVVVCMITFAEYARLQHPFIDIGSISPERYRVEIDRRPIGTSAGQALYLALEQLEYAKSIFENADVEFRTPTIIFLSDGEPNDTRAAYADDVTVDGVKTKNDANSMAEVVRRFQDEQKLNIVPVLIGEGNALAHSYMRKLANGKYYTMQTEQEYEDIFKDIEDTLSSQFTMQVGLDESVTYEDSVDVSSFGDIRSDSIIDTNSAGHIEASQDMLSAIFSSDFSGTDSDSPIGDDSSIFTL